MANTITLIPNNNTGMTNISADASYPINRGYTDADSNTFTRLNVTPGTTGSLYFLFDLSALPNDIVITNVTARYKARIYSTTRIYQTSVQLCKGTVPVGSSYTFNNTSITPAADMSDCGTWTLAELQSSLRMRVSATADTGGTAHRLDWYGADITVEYISQGYYQVIQATQLAVQIANDPSHGYNQKARYGPDYDCSSLVSYCLQQAGFAIDPHGTATSNLAPKLATLGFTDVISQIDPNTGQGLEYGDILLTVVKHHTEFSLGYANNNLIVEAVHDEHGGKGGSNTQPGDQTGDEIRIRTFYKYQWQYCFRWVDGHGGVIPDYKESFVIKLPTLRRGSRYGVIGIIQSLLQNVYGISVGSAGIDSDFGKATENAVKTFQKKNMLEVDGIIGPKTWQKLLEVEKWN